MTDSYYSANRLLGLKLRTVDDLSVGLTDLMIDMNEWVVRFLIAEADAWAPSRRVLVFANAVTDLDEARGELNLELDADGLRSSPGISADGRLDQLTEQASPAPVWQAHWRAEIAPEAGLDPPPPPVDERESELTAALDDEADFSAEPWIRAETLRRTAGETADGVAVRISDLLIDSTDWTVAFLDIALGTGDRTRSESRALIPRACIDWFERDTDTLHLAAWEDEMRTAKLQPDPVAGSTERVRIVNS
jgi:hypothetical protein